MIDTTSSAASLAAGSRARLANLLLPLAGFAAATTLTSGRTETPIGSGDAYLALLACVVLLPVAALSRRPSRELILGNFCSLALLWLFPGGSARAAAHGLLLVVVLTVALLRAFDRAHQDCVLRITLGCFAANLLFRHDLLLTPQIDAATLTRLFLLPLAAAAAVALLMRTRSPRVVFVAAGSALVLGGGWTPTTTLALLALGAGDWAAHRSKADWRRWLPLAAVVAIPLFWDPALAPQLLLCGYCLGAGRKVGPNAAVIVAAVASALLLPAARSWTDSVTVLPLLLLMLPAAPFGGGQKVHQLFAASLLGIVAQRTIDGFEGPTVAITLAALTLPTVGSAAKVQGVWSGFLAAAAGLVAGYPWLRADPLAAALDLLGAAPGWPAALVVVAALATLSLAPRLRIGGISGSTPSPCAVAILALALALYLQLPSGSRAVGALPAMLTNERPRLELDLENETIARSLIADSYLTNAASLATGTPVAVVRLVGTGPSAAEWLLRAGVDTSDWAARRQDVAALPGFKAPASWISWVTRDGRLFAQRYRAAMVLGEPLAATRLEVERAPALPPEVEIALFHLEARASRPAHPSSR